MYENSRFLKNRFTFCGVNTNFGQQWAPPAYYHLTPIVSKGKHCNGLSPERRQAIILTNAGILLIGPLGTNFSEILIAIETFSFKKMHLKISSAKWRPFCLGLNVLTRWGLETHICVGESGHYCNSSGEKANKMSSAKYQPCVATSMH